MILTSLFTGIILSSSLSSCYLDKGPSHLYRNSTVLGDLNEIENFADRNCSCSEMFRIWYQSEFIEYAIRNEIWYHTEELNRRLEDLRQRFGSSLEMIRKLKWVTVVEFSIILYLQLNWIFNIRNNQPRQNRG